MDIDLDKLIAHLRKTRCSITELKAPQAEGVYAVFACSPESIAPFPVGDDGLIYIGISSNLAEREFEHHFNSTSTGFSTLRRSLGAIRREQLSLVPIPRSPGSKTNYYKFKSDGEERLTKWMRENLEIGVCAIQNAAQIETELIKALKPVLNLTKWQNPHRKEIKLLRKQCAEDAQTHY